MRKDSIFVSIASYRDSKCINTVRHLFEQAKHPERIFVGICQQNKMNDPDCLDNQMIKKYSDNIRIMRISYKKAKGPTYARYLCSTLFRNEDFFLQIDSHSLFKKHWDELCIQMISSLESKEKNKKYVLSHYPPQYNEFFEQDKNGVTHITDCYFTKDDIISFKGALYKTPSDMPRRNAFVAAGFIFSRGSLVKDVPFDPHLPYLFTGEEILLSIRFFTSGYDVYTPNHNIVYHAYIRKNEPKFWDDHSIDTRDALQKVRFLSGLEKDVYSIQNPIIRKSLVHYGLGKERTLDDFFTFIGVDINTKTIGKPLVEFFSPPLSFYPFKPIYSCLVLFAVLFFCWMCMFFFYR